MRIAGGVSSKFVCVFEAKEDCDKEDEENRLLRGVCTEICACGGAEKDGGWTSSFRKSVNKVCWTGE